MRQREVMSNIGAVELSEWIAYDMASDPDFRKKTLYEISIKNQQKQTADEYAQRVLMAFRNLNGSV